MLKLLNYLLSRGIHAVDEPCPQPDDEWRGLPALTESPCEGTACNACVNVCPTQAIKIVSGTTDSHKIETNDVMLDLGSCIQCGLCIEECHTGTIVENKTFKVAADSREDLVLATSTDRMTRVKEFLESAPVIRKQPIRDGQLDAGKTLFSESLHIRVVSTGCSACDAEVKAVSNPNYDIERFGVSVVSSPRFADAVVVTGPVGKAMHNPLLSCYEAMSQPRIVIAVGACAISGGMHKGSYAETNGVDSVLPVNIYIPGCPPHPWSIVQALLVAMGKMEPFKPTVLPRRMLK